MGLNLELDCENLDITAFDRKRVRVSLGGVDTSDLSNQTAEIAQADALDDEELAKYLGEELVQLFGTDDLVAEIKRRGQGDVEQAVEDLGGTWP